MRKAIDTTRVYDGGRTWVGFFNGTSNCLGDETVEEYCFGVVNAHVVESISIRQSGRPQDSARDTHARDRI